MNNLEQYEQFSALSDWLDEHSSKPEEPYFFHEESESGYSEAESFCWDCIHELMPNAKIGEHFGGGYCMEEDSCCNCEKCGTLLQYDLTDYGVQSELEHFEENNPPDELTPDVCYHLAQVATGIWKDDDILIGRFMALGIKPENDECSQLRI